MCGEVTSSQLLVWRPDSNSSVLFLAILDPRVGRTIDILSPFMSVLCHSDWLFHSIFQWLWLVNQTASDTVIEGSHTVSLQNFRTVKYFSPGLWTVWVRNAGLTHLCGGWMHSVSADVICTEPLKRPSSLLYVDFLSARHRQNGTNAVRNSPIDPSLSQLQRQTTQHS